MTQSRWDCSNADSIIALRGQKWAFRGKYVAPERGLNVFAGLFYKYAAPLALKTDGIRLHWNFRRR
jgi:hypothetical protein